MTAGAYEDRRQSCKILVLKPFDAIS